MNGNFEHDESYYPIGYMGTKADGKYLTDMRSLNRLDERKLPEGNVAEICSHANFLIRSGWKLDDVLDSTRQKWDAILNG